jgi:hypothetical protein
MSRASLLSHLQTQMDAITKAARKMPASREANHGELSTGLTEFQAILNDDLLNTATERAADEIRYSIFDLNLYLF